MRHGPLLWTEVYLGHYYVLTLQPVQILVFFVHGISTDASLIKQWSMYEVNSKASMAGLSPNFTQLL